MPTPIRLLLPAAWLALASTARAFDLSVQVLDANPDHGVVAGALYDQSHWMGQPLQGERQPAGARVILVYRNLPAGRYAVSVFQDENGNGKLDANFVGMPLERYGFSRDARGRLGPPAFGDAAIDVQADTSITIHLR